MPHTLPLFLPRCPATLPLQLPSHLSSEPLPRLLQALLLHSLCYVPVWLLAGFLYLGRDSEVLLRGQKPSGTNLNQRSPKVLQCRAVQQLLSTHPPNRTADSDQLSALGLAATLERITENMNQDQYSLLFTVSHSELSCPKESCPQLLLWALWHLPLTRQFEAWDVRDFLWPKYSRNSIGLCTCGQQNIHKVL